MPKSSRPASSSRNSIQDAPSVFASRTSRWPRPSAISSGRATISVPLEIRSTWRCGTTIPTRAISIEGFRGALQQVMAVDLANQWAWMFNQAFHRLAAMACGRRHPSGAASVKWSLAIRLPPARSAWTFPRRRTSSTSSVGSFATPNPYEAKVAGEMLDDWLDNWAEASSVDRGRTVATVAPLSARPDPRCAVAVQARADRRRHRRRHLLQHRVPRSPGRLEHPGFAVPARVLLPSQSHRCGGWFPSCFGRGRRGPRTKLPTGPPRPGRRIVLLFGDIVEALLQTAAPVDGTPCVNAAELAERLTDARLAGDRIVPGPAGIPFFNADGQRQSGTGEHVVCLKPMWIIDRLLPRATIEVWAWRRRDWSHGERGQHWQRVGEPLTVRYNDHRPSRARGAAE